MKKQLILAAISAALVTAPFIEAAAKPSSSSSPSRSSSGFSSSKSSSGFKSSSSSGYKSSSSSSSSGYKPSSSNYGSSSSYKPSSSGYTAPKRDYAPTPAPTRVDTNRSTSNSGMSGFGLSSRKAEPAQPRASDYAQSNRVTPQPSTLSGSTAAAVPAQSKTGFATTTSSSTKKKLAGAAGATALGGALYVAGSNQEAVAAYEASQQPAPAPAAAPTSTATTSSAAAPTNSTKYDTRTAGVPTHQPAPQVIVMKERHYPSNDSYYDTQDAYREGVRDAQRAAERSARIATQSSNSYEPSLQMPRAQVTQPSAPAVAPVAKQESGIGSFIMWTIVTLMVLGALAFFIMQVLNIGSPKSSTKPSARRSNYTL